MDNLHNRKKPAEIVKGGGSQNHRYASQASSASGPLKGLVVVGSKDNLYQSRKDAADDLRGDRMHNLIQFSELTVPNYFDNQVYQNAARHIQQQTAASHKKMSTTGGFGKVNCDQKGYSSQGSRLHQFGGNRQVKKQQLSGLDLKLPGSNHRGSLVIPSKNYDGLQKQGNGVEQHGEFSKEVKRSFTPFVPDSNFTTTSHRKLQHTKKLTLESQGSPTEMAHLNTNNQNIHKILSNQKTIRGKEKSKFRGLIDGDGADLMAQQLERNDSLRYEINTQVRNHHGKEFSSLLKNNKTLPLKDISACQGSAAKMGQVKQWDDCPADGIILKLGPDGYAKGDNFVDSLPLNDQLTRTQKSQKKTMMVQEGVQPDGVFQQWLLKNKKLLQLTLHRLESKRQTQVTNQNRSIPIQQESQQQTPMLTARNNIGHTHRQASHPPSLSLQHHAMAPTGKNQEAQNQKLAQMTPYKVGQKYQSKATRNGSNHSYQSNAHTQLKSHLQAFLEQRRSMESLDLGMLDSRKSNMGLTTVAPEGYGSIEEQISELNNQSIAICSPKTTLSDDRGERQDSRRFNCKMQQKSCQFMLDREGQKVCCGVPAYKQFRYCHRHYIHLMKLDIRKTMSFIYKDPASCYGSFDPTGKGFVTWHDIENHIIMQKLFKKYNPCDIKAWLERDKVLQKAKASHFSKSAFKQSSKMHFNTSQDQILGSNNERVLRKRAVADGVLIIDYLQFKKHVFPHLLNIYDDIDKDGDPGEQWHRNFISSNKKDPVKVANYIRSIMEASGKSTLVDIFLNAMQDGDFRFESQILDHIREKENENWRQESIAERLLVLDSQIKHKLSTLWVSVRKAFLDIDENKDGFIDAADIMRFFADEDPIDSVLLEKLMREKYINNPQRLGQKLDQGSDQAGSVGVGQPVKLSCSDFTNWVGESIHRREGFYFRHDSIKNLQFHQHINKRQSKMKENIKAIQENVDIEQMKKLILEKFGLQWSTIKKAFAQLNLEKTGKIRPYELRHILEHWGIVLSQNDFDQIFNWFDKDQKGYFTVFELQNTAGNSIQPQESLYFRQDNSIREKLRLCYFKGCLRRPLGYEDICIVHLKEEKQKALNLLLNIYKVISQKQESTNQLLPQSKVVNQKQGESQQRQDKSSVNNDFHLPSARRPAGQRWQRFINQVVQRSQQRYKPTGTNIVVVKVFQDAVLQFAGIRLSQKEISLLERAFKCKERITAKEYAQETNDPNAVIKNSKNQSLACLDICESLSKLTATSKMMDAYTKQDYSNCIDGAGDKFVDYHGAIQNNNNTFRKGLEQISAMEFTDFKQLADVVGNGKLKEAIDVETTHISRFQQLRDQYLGIDSGLDFMKYYEFFLKELDPAKNGYVTNQELEDIFKIILPSQLSGVNLKKAFRQFASIQNKLLIDYKRVQQALQISINKKNSSIKSGNSRSELNQIMTKDDLRRERLRPSKGAKETLKHDISPDTLSTSAKLRHHHLSYRSGKRMKAKIDTNELRTLNYQNHQSTSAVRSMKKESLNNDHKAKQGRDFGGNGQGQMSMDALVKLRINEKKQREIPLTQKKPSTSRIYFKDSSNQQDEVQKSSAFPTSSTFEQIIEQAEDTNNNTPQETIFSQSRAKYPESIQETKKDDKKSTSTRQLLKSQESTSLKLSTRKEKLAQTMSSFLSKSQRQIKVNEKYQWSSLLHKSSSRNNQQLQGSYKTSQVMPPIASLHPYESFNVFDNAHTSNQTGMKKKLSNQVHQYQKHYTNDPHRQQSYTNLNYTQNDLSL